MNSQRLQLPVASSSSSSSSIPSISSYNHPKFHSNNAFHFNCKTENPAKIIFSLSFNHVNHGQPIRLVRVGADASEVGSPATATAFDDGHEVEPTPEDLEYVGQIKRRLRWVFGLGECGGWWVVVEVDVKMMGNEGDDGSGWVLGNGVLELLKKNRDMFFGEVHNLDLLWRAILHILAVLQL
ncbi:hypothetical protein RDABS01_017051 [Bienertia sinuspersici]